MQLNLGEILASTLSGLMSNIKGSASVEMGEGLSQEFSFDQILLQMKEEVQSAASDTGLAFDFQQGQPDLQQWRNFPEEEVITDDPIIPVEDASVLPAALPLARLDFSGKQEKALSKSKNPLEALSLLDLPLPNAQEPAAKEERHQDLIVTASDPEKPFSIPPMPPQSGLPLSQTDTSLVPPDETGIGQQARQASPAKKDFLQVNGLSDSEKPTPGQPVLIEANETKEKPTLKTDEFQVPRSFSAEAPTPNPPFKIEGVPAQPISTAPQAMTSHDKPNLPLQQPLGKPEWADELGERLLWMQQKSVQMAELRLNPAHLGPMEVKIQVNQDQTLLHFSAQHAPVREAIDAALPRLREMFNAQELTLTHVEVSSQNLSDQRQSQQERRHLFANPQVDWSEEQVEFNGDMEERRISKGHRLLNLYA